MALDMSGSGTIAPASGDVPPGDTGRTGEQSVVRRAAPLASLICWFYLSIIGCLVLWIFVVRLVVGWDPMIVMTGSMEPSINPGDIVMAGTPEDGGRGLEDGTVITFADPVRPGGRLTHRIESVNADGTYKTRGDANADADSYRVEPDDIEGVGRLLIPAVGLPRVWLERGDLALMGLWVVGTLLAMWAALRPTRRFGDD